MYLMYPTYVIMGHLIDHFEKQQKMLELNNRIVHSNFCLGGDNHLYRLITR